MTECVDIAFGYTQNKAKDLSKRPRSTIFVNEVLESEKLKVLKFKDIFGINDSSEELHQFHKHHHERSAHTNETDYKKDSLGRRYRNLPVTSNELMDEYVARDSVTIPRYLIVFQPQVEN